MEELDKEEEDFYDNDEPMMEPDSATNLLPETIAY